MDNQGTARNCAEPSNSEASGRVPEIERATYHPYGCEGLFFLYLYIYIYSFSRSLADSLSLSLSVSLCECVHAESLLGVFSKLLRRFLFLFHYMLYILVWGFIVVVCRALV